MSESIKVTFVPGMSFDADNAPHAIGKRCAAVAEHFRIESRIEDAIGRPAEADALRRLSTAFLCAVAATRASKPTDGPYTGPDDRSPGWWGRAMAHRYGADDSKWPAFEMQANHPGRATAPEDAVFRMPD